MNTEIHKMMVPKMMNPPPLTTKSRALSTVESTVFSAQTVASWNLRLSDCIFAVFQLASDLLLADKSES